LGERGRSGRVDERRRNVDLLIRSSLEKERTDNMDKNMAEVCEVDFRRALFKFLYFTKQIYFYTINMEKSLLNLNQCDKYIKSKRLFPVSCLKQK